METNNPTPEPRCNRFTPDSLKCAKLNKVKIKARSGALFTLGTVGLTCTRTLYPWGQLLLASPWCKHGHHVCQHQPWWPSILVQESWLHMCLAHSPQQGFHGGPWSPSDGRVSPWAAQGKQLTGDSYETPTHRLSCDFIHEVDGKGYIIMRLILLLNKTGILCWKTTSQNMLQVSCALVHLFKSL